MKRLAWRCLFLLAAIILFSGCAIPSSHPGPLVPGTQIHGMEASKTVFVLDQTYISETGGIEYVLPYGTYRPEGQDKNGIYYKAPIPLKKRGMFGGLLSLGRESFAEGGVYVPLFEGKPSFSGDVWLYLRQKDGSVDCKILAGPLMHDYGKHWDIRPGNDVGKGTSVDEGGH
jgi:hypothetical protein